MIAMAIAWNRSYRSPTNQPPRWMTVQAQIMDLLQRLQAERNMAMILITHDRIVARKMRINVAVMWPPVR